MKNIYAVTGGLGMIGSFLVDSLLDDPMTKRVVIIDDLSSGKLEHVQHHGANIADGRLKIYEADLVDPQIVHHEAWRSADCVFHLAANPCARRGIEDTTLDLRLETVATRNTLEGMRLAGVSKIIFSSSGTVYGDCAEKVCKEAFGERLPTSLYGAGKVASEALISAYCGTFGFSSVIFRFGNVCGERAGHGCIFDFINQLLEHPDHLDVLGDGNQSKPYLYVKEVVAGMIHGLKLIEAMPAGACEPYNLAPWNASSVKFIAETLVHKMGLCSKINYGETASGWAGDVPHSRMDMTKLENTGFSLLRSSDGAVDEAIEQILKA